MKELSDLLPFSYRCVRTIRCTTHREPTGEVPVCSRRVLPEPVPQPANKVRETPPPTAFATHRQLSSHRTALLRKISWEDTNRDPNQGYAAIRQFILVAVYGDHVTYDVATAGSGMIHALRLPALSAEPTLRPLQIHP